MRASITISVAQIMKYCTVQNVWLKTREQRDGWIQRFMEEIEGIRRNMEKEQARIDEGKEDWHLDWAIDNVNYLKREIRKRERYIRKLQELNSASDV